MASKNTDTTELVPATNAGYLVEYAEDIGGLQEIITENFGGGGITPRELPRIRIPAGGGKQWEVPTLEGSDYRAEFKGVIVHWKTLRAYWPEPFETGAGSPPQCTSDDGIVGMGDPGTICAKCEFNQFGTAQYSTKPGKACREVRALFVIDEASHLPYFMPLPPMSIPPAKLYFTKLAQAGVSFWQVETTFALEQTKNKTGITFSRGMLNLARRLAPDEIGRVSAMREALKPAIDGTQLTRDDVGE